MSIYLWLDDVRTPPSGWVWVKTADECIQALTRNTVEEVSLDHDLADEHYDKATWGDATTYREKTGMHVVDWMVEHGVWPAKVHIHTMNPVGRETMRKAVLRHAPDHLGLVYPGDEAYKEMLSNRKTCL